ncbi:MAG TPA: sugar-binding protein, partial [Thermoanaerobaculia bacterium]
MKRTTLLLLLAGLVLAPIARGANWPDRPTLRAVRVASAPAIDGDLSDAAWQSAPEFTDFTQHDPDDGAPATMRTSIRVVYDDKAIYFGAQMDDPGKPTALLVRRDNFGTYDFLSINIDPQHDR